jgi:hypothetical protein
MARRVFEEERLGLHLAMGMAVEPNPNRPFLIKFGLLKVADLIAAKIIWAWPKIKSDLAPYKAMDKFMKYLLVYFIQVFIFHYGGFKVLKSSLVASSSILSCSMPSPCVFMLQCLSLSSMLGPSFIRVTNTSDLGSIIFSCM